MDNNNCKVESENLELDSKENINNSFDYKTALDEMERNFRRFKIKHAKDIEITEVNVRKKVAEELTNHYQATLERQRNMKNELMEQLKEKHENALDNLHVMYQNKIKKLKKLNENTMEHLTNMKKALEKQNENNLNSIDNLIESITGSLDPAEDEIQNIHNKIFLKKPVVVEIPSDSNENLELKTKVEQYEKKILQYEKKIEQYDKKIETFKNTVIKLEEQLKAERTLKENIQQKLQYTELVYKQSVIEQENKLKIMRTEYSTLLNEKNDMVRRHEEQFSKYEKMLLKANKEISVHQREVHALRTQFVPGTPPANHSSNKCTDSQSQSDSDESKSSRLLRSRPKRTPKRFE